MVIGNSPTIFVSSTCYDLAQIRIDLKQFIESLGMIPCLSEFQAFPVDTELDAIANCLANVEKNADIFVLVIGGRYGSVTGNGKSVTNLEYIEAKSKKIPIYIFIQKAILNVYPVWQSNKEGDFSAVADCNDLFKFIHGLKDVHKEWIFSFESAHDISNTLRVQLGYLFMESLSARKKVHGGVAPVKPDTLRLLTSG